MSDDVSGPWSDNIPAKKLGDADFEARDKSLSFYDPNGIHIALADALSERFEESRSAIIDRAVRIYLAHLIDSRDFPDLRSEFKIVTLIPPSDWSLNHPELDIDKNNKYEYKGESISPTTTKTIKELTGRLTTSELVKYENNSELIRDSIIYMNEGQIEYDDSPSESLARVKMDTSGGENDTELPSALHCLFKSKARQTLADYFIELGLDWQSKEESGCRPRTKSDIIDATGLQRKSVIDHIDVLVALGLVEINDDHGHDRYMPAVNGDVFWAVNEANNLLYEAWEENEPE